MKIRFLGQACRQFLQRSYADFLKPSGIQVFVRIELRAFRLPHLLRLELPGLTLSSEEAVNTAGAHTKHLTDVNLAKAFFAFFDDAFSQIFTEWSSHPKLISQNSQKVQPSFNLNANCSSQRID
jgi:hypothetical protein